MLLSNIEPSIFYQAERRDAAISLFGAELGGVRRGGSVGVTVMVPSVRLSEVLVAVFCISRKEVYLKCFLDVSWCCLCVLT